MTSEGDGAWMLRVHGAELFGFLSTTIGDPTAAREAYDTVAKRIAAGLVSFRGTCSPRVWLYFLARQELNRLTVPLAPARTLLDPSATPYRSIPPDARALLRSLPLDDRVLLVLRAHGRMTWREIAVTTLGAEASDHTLREEAVRLRSRFSSVRNDVLRRARGRIMEEASEPSRRGSRPSR